MGRTWGIGLFFFLSGFAALIYQVIWQRILGIFSGVHIYSVTMIVAAFMAGLGFGSLVGGRIADRLEARKALLGFVVCEVGIGLFALASPWLYYDVAYLRLGFLVQYPALLPLVHFLLVLIPTFLMGASLPLLARGAVRDTEGAARTVALFYGLNTLGAGAGALITIWFLIGEIGFTGTIRCGAALNFTAALGAWWLARRWPASPDVTSHSTTGTAASPASAIPESSRRWAGWALLYGLSGFIALSLELLWFRTLDVALKSSPYTFGHLLAIFLTVLGIGSLIGIRLVDRIRRPDRAFLLAQSGVVLTAAIGICLLGRYPSWMPFYEQLHSYWFLPGGVDIAATSQAIRQGFSGDAAGVLRDFVLVYGVLPSVILVLPVFLMGMSYPLVQRVVQTDIAAVGWRTGAVQTANIVGSMLGSVVTGAVLLNQLGTPRSFAVVLIAGVAFALMLRGRLSGRAARAAVALLIIAQVWIALAIPGPQPFWSRLHGMTSEGVLVAEDATGVASIQLINPELSAMRVNGNMHSKVPFGDEHTLLGAMPVLLDSEIREALVIGLGSGNTAWAVGCRPEVARIDVFEIVAPERDVLEQFVERFPSQAAVQQALTDPRIHMSFSDGRLALRTTDKEYDMIEADGLEPSMAFSGNLYSKEFFELCQSRLRAGGIFCTYVPTERTRRTVLSVFPHALDFHAPNYASFIIAANHPLTFEREAVRERLYSSQTQTYFTRSKLHQASMSLLSDFLDTATVTVVDASNREQLTRGDINTDLFPRDEFDKGFTGEYQ